MLLDVIMISNVRSLNYNKRLCWIITIELKRKLTKLTSPQAVCRTLTSASAIAFSQLSKSMYSEVQSFHENGQFFFPFKCELGIIHNHLPYVSISTYQQAFVLSAAPSLGLLQQEQNLSLTFLIPI